MKKFRYLFSILFFVFSITLFGQSKTNSFQVGWFRAWQENWGVSYNTMELKYQKNLNEYFGFYSSFSNYFKSKRIENDFVLIFNERDTIIYKNPFSISRYETEKYPFLTEEDYSNLKRTGVFSFKPKLLRQQLYIFEIGATINSPLIKNHHQFAIQIGANLTYVSMKSSGNVETISNLYVVDKEKELIRPLFEYFTYYRNIDFCFGIGINYKYHFNKRLYLGIETNLHNGLFITLINDSLIPGYLGLGLIIGSKF